MSNDLREELLGAKAAIQRLLLAKSPFRHFISSYKKRFDRLVLLPLQFSGYYLFDSICDYQSQFEYLTDVLEKVPRNIGVVVTTHPEYKGLTDEVLAYVQEKYPHFIYDKQFEDYYASSQYLMGEVDGVITVSSSIGLQTLFWDNKLISIGKGFLSFMADGTDLDHVQFVLNEPVDNKDELLYWIMTRYAVPKAYICNANWMRNFLENSIKNFKKNVNLMDFYFPIDDEKKLLSNLSLALITDIPHFTTDFPNENLNRRFTPAKASVMECYLDYGSGFQEEDCIRKKVLFGQQSVTIPVGSKGVRNIRIDPLNGCGVVGINRICLYTENRDEFYELQIASSNAEYNIGNLFCFLNEDPQLYLERTWGDAKIKELEIDYWYLDINIYNLEVVKGIINQEKSIIKEIKAQLTRSESELTRMVIESRDLQKAYDVQEANNLDLKRQNNQLSQANSHLEKVNSELKNSVLNLEKANSELKKSVLDLGKVNSGLNYRNEELEQINEITMIRIQAFESKLIEMENTVSWKLTRPLRELYKLLKNLVDR
nr:hypothetical protein [Cohnella sp. CFH 77786]